MRPHGWATSRCSGNGYLQLILASIAGRLGQNLVAKITLCVVLVVGFAIAIRGVPKTDDQFGDCTNELQCGVLTCPVPGRALGNPCDLHGPSTGTSWMSLCLRETSEDTLYNCPLDFSISVSRPLKIKCNKKKLDVDNCGMQHWKIGSVLLNITLSRYLMFKDKISFKLRPSHKLIADSIIRTANF